MHAHSCTYAFGHRSVPPHEYVDTCTYMSKIINEYIVWNNCRLTGKLQQCRLSAYPSPSFPWCWRIAQTELFAKDKKLTPDDSELSRLYFSLPSFLTLDSFMIKVNKPRGRWLPTQLARWLLMSQKTLVLLFCVTLSPSTMWMSASDGTPRYITAYKEAISPGWTCWI